MERPVLHLPDVTELVGDEVVAAVMRLPAQQDDEMRRVAVETPQPWEPERRFRDDEPHALDAYGPRVPVERVEACLRRHQRRMRPAHALLREGAQSTAVVKTAKRVETRFGYPMYELELTVRLPNGAEHAATKSGAIPPSWDGSLDPGDELPIRIRPEDQEFAIDWGGGF